MEKENLISIIKTCKQIDEKAGVLYERFSSVMSDPELVSFWHSMAEEERGHDDFWDKLLALATETELPQVFDNPPQIEKELAAIRERADHLLAQVGESVGLHDAFMAAYKLEFTLLHPAFERLFAYAKTFDSTENPADQYERHISRFLNTMCRYLDRESLEFELLCETIRNLWQSNRSLAFISSVDELTGALNRRGFFQAIQPLSYLAQRKKMEIGIIMVDIDDFKQINDTHGHQMGDRVLQKVAGDLQKSVRTSDIVGRYGGEEFVIYLSSADEEAVLRVGEKLRMAVEKPAADIPRATVSIGGATGILEHDVHKELVELVHSADQQLYNAKQLGKNRVIAVGLVKA
ncbi:MAG: diguanylate cyclase [Chitinivibrionales bacterium]